MSNGDEIAIRTKSHPPPGHARLRSVIKFLLLLTLINVPGVFAEGNDRILHLYGKDFSFKVAEPVGWKLDTRSAPQIANFIFHPVGQNWRRSNALIFARFIPKKGSMTLEDFLEENQTRFEEECPFADPETPESSIGLKGRFKTKTFTCPGFHRRLIRYSLQ